MSVYLYIIMSVCMSIFFFLPFLFSNIILINFSQTKFPKSLIDEISFNFWDERKGKK